MSKGRKQMLAAFFTLKDFYGTVIEYAGGVATGAG
jgi:hypothetical protein